MAAAATSTFGVRVQLNIHAAADASAASVYSHEHHVVASVLVEMASVTWCVVLC